VEGRTAGLWRFRRQSHMVTPIPIRATAPTPPAIPPIRAPLLELLELEEIEELDPGLDPPIAVAEAPGEVAVALGMGLPPLLVAADPPVGAAAVASLVKGNNLAINIIYGKRARKME
jgi:hypothetical protein